MLVIIDLIIHSQIIPPKLDAFPVLTFAIDLDSLFLCRVSRRPTARPPRREASHNCFKKLRQARTSWGLNNKKANNVVDIDTTRQKQE